MKEPDEYLDDTFDESGSVVGETVKEVNKTINSEEIVIDKTPAKLKVKVKKPISRSPSPKSYRSEESDGDTYADER